MVLCKYPSFFQKLKYQRPLVLNEVAGEGWLLVEDIIGLFTPKITFKPEYVVLDRNQNVLHYQKGYKRLDLEDVSFLTPIVDPNYRDCGRWKLVIQDIRKMQEWILYFASEERLLAWTELLQTAIRQCNHSAIISSIVTLDLVDQETRDASDILSNQFTHYYPSIELESVVVRS